jgi:hypothetical protein
MMAKQLTIILNLENADHILDWRVVTLYPKNFVRTLNSSLQNFGWDMHAFVHELSFKKTFYRHIGIYKISDIFPN